MNSLLLAKKMRVDILNMIHASHASHIGSAFSIVDILAVLYSDVLVYDTSNDSLPIRDRLILSKGHAGAALYSVLGEIGFFDIKLLDQYEKNGSCFSGHISHSGVPGIELSTGSLGHGVCVATGMALAGKLNDVEYRVFAIVGDGEINEGSFWETVLFANHNCLSNLTIIIDHNHMQATGTTERILETVDIGNKMESFGWNVIQINGHNHSEIKKALETSFPNNKPKCIVANTIKGKGVSFFENSLLWHYRDPQGVFYEKALLELTGEKHNEE